MKYPDSTHSIETLLMRLDPQLARNELEWDELKFCVEQAYLIGKRHCAMSIVHWHMQQAAECEKHGFHKQARSHELDADNIRLAMYNEGLLEREDAK